MQNLLTLRPPLKTQPQKAALPGRDEAFLPTHKACPPSCSISRGDTLTFFIHIKIIHEYSWTNRTQAESPTGKFSFVLSHTHVCSRSREHSQCPRSPPFQSLHLPPREKTTILNSNTSKFLFLKIPTIAIKREALDPFPQWSWHASSHPPSLFLDTCIYT